MRTLAATCVSAAAACSLLTAAAAPAVAAPTDSATLTCGSEEYKVTGFGRGQILHVVDSNSKYVVTFARLDSGQVVFEAPGQSTKGDTVTCTTTPPGSTNTFTFRGFFTPRQ